MQEFHAPGASEPIVKEIDIAAPPSIVYEYLTQDDKIMEWMGLEVDVDPKPGGAFRIVPNDRHVIRGEYVEATPFSKVAFTWGYEGDDELPPGASLVEITLEPTSAGTRLRLVHSGIADPEWNHDHNKGWDYFVERIAGAAEGRPMEPNAYAGS
jgi:uncharacterized protein YndB with AHSA1/START domain